MHALPVFLIAAVLAGFSTPARATEIAAESTLRAATVYSSRATLTRRAVVDLPAGAHAIVFDNLPAGLMPESLRAEGSAAADVTFGALASKMTAQADLASPREKELNDKLEELGDRHKIIEAEKLALAVRQNFLHTLSQQAALRTQEDIAEIDLKPGQWKDAALALYDGVAEVAKARAAQAVALRTLDREIAAAQNELAQLQTGQRSMYKVTLPIEARTATRLTVDLQYQIPQAGWTPVYDARLDTKTGELELIQYGSVRQNTGEDWNGIALTLSTAQPQRGAGLPDLQTMWVNVYEEMAQRMKVASFSMEGAGAAPAYVNAPMAQEDKDGAIDALKVVEEKAHFVAAEIETGGYISEYKIPGPANVPADGTESKLMIGPFETANDLRIQVKPQISAEAYLVAHATLKGEAPILPGPVSLFRDGAYVGQSGLPLLRPGQESDLAFGVDDQVSVRRRTLKDERSETGLLARDNVLERHFVTEIQNLHSAPVSVVVLETVPVAQDKQIAVEILGNTTTPGYKQDIDDVKGLLRWEVKLEPKAKSDLKLGWKLGWPKDRSLSGI